MADEEEKNVAEIASPKESSDKVAPEKEDGDPAKSEEKVDEQQSLAEDESVPQEVEEAPGEQPQVEDETTEKPEEKTDAPPPVEEGEAPRKSVDKIEISPVQENATSTVPEEEIDQLPLQEEGGFDRSAEEEDKVHELLSIEENDEVREEVVKKPPTDGDDVIDLFNTATDILSVNLEEEEEEEGEIEEEGEFEVKDIQHYLDLYYEEVSGAGEGIEIEEGEEEEEEYKPKEIKEESKPKKLKKKRKIITSRIPRFGGQRISGDFQPYFDGSDFDITGSTLRYPSIVQYEELDEYTTEEEEEEEEKVPIVREDYYNLYRDVFPRRNYHKMKNNFLHKKMADYYKKRRMDHVLKENDNLVDTQLRYFNKLDAFGNLIEKHQRKRDTITAELDDMRNARDDDLESLALHFEKMQKREKEVGLGLISSKTGKEISDKVVERFLKRQEYKCLEIASKRLLYIKLRDRIATKKEALQKLDDLGPDLHLLDYEQLKNEKQCHTEKIEERTEIMATLHKKFKSTVQCLAHVREKSAAIIIDTIKAKERLDEVEAELQDAREHLHQCKKEREQFRFETKKLRDIAGVIGKPKLCADMQRSIEEEKLLIQLLEELKMENSEIKASTANIKKNITELIALKVKEAKKFKMPYARTGKFYKGRPTLQIPQLPDSEWSL